MVPHFELDKAEEHMRKLLKDVGCHPQTTRKPFCEQPPSMMTPVSHYWGQLCRLTLVTNLMQLLTQ